MRILLFSASYHPILGGLQTATGALARHLAAMRHEVMVVTNRYPRSLPAQENIDGVPVRRWLFVRPGLHHLLGGRIDLLAASLYLYPATLRRLHQLMREFRPEIVNIHFPDNQISHLLRLRRRHAFRLVVSLHGDDIERWTSPGPSRARGASLAGLRSLLREADAVTACSQYLAGKAAEVERSIAAKTRVIPNGIELERFSNHSRYLHARPYVLAYGRLVHKKGFDLLIRAFAQVAPDFADTDLLIAGEGDQRAALDQLCAQSGISGRVHFCGRAGQSEIVRLLNGCRLMVIPSRQEPFGIAALEALAAGKPMLATRVGGLPEVARGPYVTVVEPTVTGLVAGLRERLGAPLAAPARRTPLAWSRVAEQYLALYSGHVTPEPACCEVLGASSL